MRARAPCHSAGIGRGRRRLPARGQEQRGRGHAEHQGAAARGPPLSGYLNLIPSPVATQALAAAGADVVVIDQEHGPIGAESVHAMVAATAGTQCSPWARVPSVDEPATKSALDAGAEGILFPLPVPASSPSAFQRLCIRSRSSRVMMRSFIRPSSKSPEGLSFPD